MENSLRISKIFVEQLLTEFSAKAAVRGGQRIVRKIAGRFDPKILHSRKALVDRTAELKKKIKKMEASGKIDKHKMDMMRGEVKGIKGKLKFIRKGAVRAK